MKKLLILSGKGGTGKTTVASALIRLFDSKALCDCDVDAPNLHILNSFKSAPESSAYIGGKRAVFDSEKCIDCHRCVGACRFNALRLLNEKVIFNELSCEGCGVCEYICPTSALHLEDDFCGYVDVFKDDKILSTAELKMGRGNSGKLVTEVKKALFNEVQNVNNNLQKSNSNSDFSSVAILDGSPGVGCPVMASISGVDLILIVTEPTLSGFHDLKRILKTVNLCGAVCTVCVNKYDINEDMTNKIIEYTNSEKINFVGKIPYTKEASEFINKGVSIIDFDCPMSREIKNIYLKLKELLGV